MHRKGPAGRLQIRPPKTPRSSRSASCSSAKLATSVRGRMIVAVALLAVSWGDSELRSGVCRMDLRPLPRASGYPICFPRANRNRVRGKRPRRSGRGIGKLQRACQTRMRPRVRMLVRLHGPDGAVRPRVPGDQVRAHFWVQDRIELEHCNAPDLRGAVPLRRVSFDPLVALGWPRRRLLQLPHRHTRRTDRVQDRLRRCVPDPGGASGYRLHYRHLHAVLRAQKALAGGSECPMSLFAPPQVSTHLPSGPVA